MATTKDLLFIVSSKAFKQLQGNSTSSYTFVQGRLTVPWIDKGLLWNDYKTSSFPVGFEVIPNIPGNTTVVYHTKFKTVSKQIADGPHTIGDPEFLKEISASADPGWTIDRNSVSCDKCCYFTPQWRIDNGNVAVCTYRFGKGEWGTVYIRFTETRDIDGDDWSEPFTIQWGDQQVFSAPSNSTISAIYISAFDGQQMKLVAPDYTNPYFDISTTADGRWIVKARYLRRN